MVAPKKRIARMEKQLADLQQKNAIETNESFSDVKKEFSSGLFQVIIDRSFLNSDLVKETLINIRKETRDDIEKFVTDTGKVFVDAIESFKQFLKDNSQAGFNTLNIEPGGNNDTETEQTAARNNKKEEITETKKQRLNEISEFAKETKTSLLSETETTKSEKIKRFFEEVANQTLNADIFTEEKREEKARKNLFVATERQLRAEEFSGKSEKKIKKELELEYKNQKDRINQLIDLENKLADIKKQGRSENDIENTSEYKQRESILNALVNSKSTTFSGFRESGSKENLSLGALEEQNQEDSVIREKEFQEQEEQTTLLEKIHGLLALSAKSDNSDKSASSSDSGGSGLLSGLLGGAGLKSLMGAIVPLIGPIVATAAAAFAVKDTITAIKTGESKSNDIARSIGLVKSKEDIEKGIDTRSNYNPLKWAGMVIDKPMEWLAGASVPVGSPALQRAGNNISSTEIKKRVVPPRNINLTTANLAQESSRITTEQAEIAKEIGKNINIKVPPPVAPPAKDKVVLQPFSQKIHNNDNTIQSFIKSRYL